MSTNDGPLLFLYAAETTRRNLGFAFSEVYLCSSVSESKLKPVGGIEADGASDWESNRVFEVLMPRLFQAVCVFRSAYRGKGGRG